MSEEYLAALRLYLEKGPRASMQAALVLGRRAVDRIDGLVITFADITVAKTLEAQLREKHAILEKFIANQAGKPEKGAEKTAKPPRTPAGARKLTASHKL